MNLRQNAIANGNVTYHSGKPCKRGHTSERYASTGQCIDCLKEQAVNTRDLAKMARRRKFALMYNDIHEHKVLVKRKHSAMVETISEISAEDGYRAQCLMAFLAILGSSELTTADLRILLHSEDGYKSIINHALFPQRHDDDGRLHIELKGEWYYVDEVMPCIRGERDSIERVPK